jgi:ribose transport system permease protein
MSRDPGGAQTFSPTRLGYLIDTLKSDWRTMLAYGVALVLYLIMVAISPSFASLEQISNILNLAAFLGIVAIGQTLVILVFGIDLSVSAVITLVNLVTTAFVAGSDARTLTAIPLALAIGAAVGLVNGLGIRYLQIPDLVMTLASFTIVTGVALLYSGGAPTGQSSRLLNKLGAGDLGGILPWSFVIWAVLAALTIFALTRTTFGRHVYAVGLNRRASRFSGINVGRTVVILYTISGATAAIAGLLLTGYTGSSYFGIGDPYQLGSIAAVVVGGTSIFGGRGGYIGTIAGVITIVLLQSLLTVLNIADAGREIAFGLVILILLVIYGRERSLRQ